MTYDLVPKIGTKREQHFLQDKAICGNGGDKYDIFQKAKGKQISNLTDKSTILMEFLQIKICVGCEHQSPVPLSRSRSGL